MITNSIYDFYYVEFYEILSNTSRCCREFLCKIKLYMNFAEGCDYCQCISEMVEINFINFGMCNMKNSTKKMIEAHLHWKE